MSRTLAIFNGMNIKIVDSWLREYLDTNAKPEEVAKALSLTSVSVDRLEKIGDDIIYDIEVTTNRPDLMSVAGIAKEAVAALSEEGIDAKFTDKKLELAKGADISFPIDIENDPKLVNRIMAGILEVEIGDSPKQISKRLETSGIRSLNNLIDITNYVMRETGHPAHVFDYDRLNTKKMTIRLSKKGEKLTTLDGKEYSLLGGDIIAVDEKNLIVDLLGVMGTANSVVTDKTKRIMFFLDNLNPKFIRNTSMNLGIRTEAAIINEKGVDPELMTDALNFGVELYKKLANGKLVTKTLDIYPNKSKTHNLKVPISQINSLIGVTVSPIKSEEILKKLGFETKLIGDYLNVTVPTRRASEVTIPEDVIEEIARVYGYHKLPSIVPGFLNNKTTGYENEFYFEKRIKNALKYWGFTEVLTYSLVSEDMFQGPIENGVKLKNPLTEDMAYLRNSLIPSLLKVVEENKSREVIKIFELANTYHKKPNELPEESLMLSGVVKKEDVNFFELKGIIEQLLTDIGVKNYKFKKKDEGGANIFIEKDRFGYVEIFDPTLINFELEFRTILKHATLKLNYKPLAKFPPVVEDMTFVLDSGINTEEVIEEIRLQSFLIREVELKDQFTNPASTADSSKTFHIIYQSDDKNLTNTEVKEIREQIIKSLEKKFNALVK